MYRRDGTEEDNGNKRIWRKCKNYEDHRESQTTMMAEKGNYTLPGGASGLFGLIMTFAPPPKTAAHMRLLSGCAARRKSSLLL